MMVEGVKADCCQLALEVAVVTMAGQCSLVEGCQTEPKVVTVGALADRHLLEV